MAQIKLNKNRQKKLKKIIIMAGGTGGHVFPGIAIGQALVKKGVQILWLGSEGGMETALAPQAGFSLETLKISGFRKKSFLKKLCLPYYLFKSVYQAYKIIKRCQPDIVLGMGGFASGPGGIAAKLLRIPLFIHEQNCIAGITNRILSYLAETVFYAFPNAFDPGSSKKFILTGNPVRRDIQKIPPKQKLHSPWRLLILGGSRGAKILNDIVPLAIKLLPTHLQPNIYHQTGRQNSAAYPQDIQKTRQIIITPFIQDMAKIYDWADIAVCRSGALTLSELCQTGIPAVLIPYPYAADDHQTANAKYLEKNHAAAVLSQTALTPEKLAQALTEIIDSPEQYAKMAHNAALLNQPQAVEKIVRILLDKIKNRARLN